MELLKKLYSIHSMSGHEDAMRKFIKNYVRENVPGCVVVQKDHNVYITKGRGTYPCVVAHLDQVQRNHSSDFRVLELDGRLFGFSAKNARQEGLGADDKNGIWVALKCLERFDNIKVAFFHSEEIGTVGSGEADMKFFKDCRFVIEADRRNGGDLITDICGDICSQEFKDDIAEIADVHGYKETSGMLTDVETLSDNGLGLSCINFSCGYYNPHTDQEYTVIEELENCLDFAMDIIEKCTKVYKFKREKSYGRYGGYGYGGYGRGYGYGYGYGYGGYYGGGSKGKSEPKNGWWNYYGSKPAAQTGNVAYAKPKEEKKHEVAVYDAEADHIRDIYTVDFKDYADPYDAVYAFVRANIDDYSQDTLWYYIEADCDTYGISYGDFEDIYDTVLEEVIMEDEGRMF